MENKRICAAYVRVSTHDQEEFSPESQVNLLHEFAKKNDMLLPEEYVFQDKGISGRRAENRPEFQRMIGMTKAKPCPFQTILVWKFSRFARNQEESIVYKSLLKKESGVDVVSISEPLAEGPFGGLIERIIEWFDEYYSIRLSGEVRRGMTERVRQGGAVSVAPIGYKFEDKQLVIDEGEAQTVHMIYDEFSNGTAMISIAKQLNAMGIKTKRGGRWENRTVRYVLTNPLYTGKVRWSPEGANDYHKTDGWNENTMVIDGAHEPIIPDETFEKVQEKLAVFSARYKSSADRVTQRANASHMLQGLVKCSACGGTLSRSGRGLLNCVQYVHGRCTQSHGVQEEVLERIVLRAIRAQFDTLDFRFAEPDEAQDTVGQEEVLRALRREQEILARCREAYAAGIDTLEEYRENKTACTARIGALQQKLNTQKREPVDKRAFAEQHRDALRTLDDATIPGAEKNKVLRSFVDHITYFKELKTIDILFRA